VVDPAAGRKKRIWLTSGRVLAVIAGFVLFITVLVAIGYLSRGPLGTDDRYLIYFIEIECPAPPGQAPTDFLDEVRYLAEMPEQINVMEAGMGDRLMAAFRRHPKVELVESVTVIPPKRVRVDLRFVSR
jgi:hypothetical protein